MALTANQAEFDNAVGLLVEGGFSNSRAIELLTKRWDIRDRFMAAALQGLCSKYALKEPGDQQTIVQMARELADVCLTERMK